MTFLQDHKFAFYHLFTFQYLGFDVCWVNSSHFHSASCFTVGWCIYLLTISKCQYFQTLISVYCHFIKIIYWWHWCNKTLICCVFLVLVLGRTYCPFGVYCWPSTQPFQWQHHSCIPTPCLVLPFSVLEFQGESSLTKE